MDSSPEKRRTSRSKRSQPADGDVPQDAGSPPLAAGVVDALDPPASGSESQPQAAAEPMRMCPGCGREVPESTRVCPYCEFVVSRYVAGEYTAPIEPEPSPTAYSEPPVAAPNLTPYIAAIVVLLMVGLIGLLLRINRPDSTQSTAPAVNRATQTAAVPGVGTIVPPSWRKVVKFKTEGSSGLVSFTIRAQQWRITWSTKPVDMTNSGRFQMQLSSQTNPKPVTIVNTSRAEQNTAEQTGPGDYTIDITSPQPCLVMVEEFL